MNKIDLSVIIVNYQSWNFLDSCLTSFIKNPPRVTYEIIIVDNYSNDGKFDDFKEAHPEVTLIKNLGNFGFSNGCNLGESFSSGKFLLFLNPDTELNNSQAIDEMVKFSRDHDDIGIVSCRNISDTGIGKEERYLSPWLMFGYLRFFYRLLNKNKLSYQYPENSDVWFPEWVTGSVVLIDSDLFRSVNGWNQNRYWMYSEDPDLCFKVSKLGRKVALLTNITIKHVGGGSSEPSTESAIRYKTEDFISKHNYIQENSKGLSRLVLHTLLFLKMQSSILSIFLLLIFNKRRRFTIKIKTLTKCWNYYLHAIRKKTWKNPRLINI